MITEILNQCNFLKEKYSGDTVFPEIYFINNTLQIEYNIDGIIAQMQNDANSKNIYIGMNEQNKRWYFTREYKNNVMQMKIPNACQLKDILHMHSINDTYIETLFVYLNSLNKTLNVSAISIDQNKTILLDIDFFAEDIYLFNIPYQLMAYYNLLYENFFKLYNKTIKLTISIILSKNGNYIIKGMRFPFVRTIYTDSSNVYANIIKLLYTPKQLSIISSFLKDINEENYDHIKIAYDNEKNILITKLYLRF